MDCDTTKPDGQKKKEKKGEKKKVMFVGCYKKSVSNDILDMNDVNDIFIISDMTTV